ncbi:probable DNA replication complex GINS protein PSF2 [Tribolium castaneum]|uniref:DNA replication complex GINS protein PSF2 n=1 Tax=Tribolium castaneum TaxID=7070 RepID=D6X0V8_TRICA|nr:PREDICTED: probable DNA replication complex GINS protein PSF2 [Tribolium castaneum]EFA10560.2 putative DNA replication complex GINS protein PSF2-like Protein [Tribolium castaneum]|eukprot:XP_968389.2 PREDICTED: probable DNA replication complex GINS protein PSF2 [Tribolium castaneum]
MDPEEVEFLGEKQLVTIVPLTTDDDYLKLISGDFGPFRMGMPVKVPLWVAVQLKRQKHCKIQPPDWMEIETLEAIKNEEKLSRNFTKMPSKFYMVEAKQILGCASDDISRADEIRTIIKDIWDIRMSKLRSSIDLLVRNNGASAVVTNLTLMEINSIRPILPHTLDQIRRMKNFKPFHGWRSQDTSFVSDSRSSTSFHS